MWFCPSKRKPLCLDPHPHNLKWQPSSPPRCITFVWMRWDITSLLKRPAQTGKRLPLQACCLIWSWQRPSHTITLAPEEASGREVYPKIGVGVEWNRSGSFWQPSAHPDRHSQAYEYGCPLHKRNMKRVRENWENTPQMSNNHVQVLNHNLSRQNELYLLFPHRKESRNTFNTHPCG